MPFITTDPVLKSKSKRKEAILRFQSTLWRNRKLNRSLLCNCIRLHYTVTVYYLFSLIRQKTGKKNCLKNTATSQNPFFFQRSQFNHIVSRMRNCFIYTTASIYKKILRCLFYNLFGICQIVLFIFQRGSFGPRYLIFCRKDQISILFGFFFRK